MNKRHPKFKDSEFACQCGCGLGIDDMHPLALELVYGLRDVLGVPVIITSAIRCNKHNKVVGGAEDSAHLTGEALDIKTPTSRIRFLFNKYLLDKGVVRIGHNYKLNFIHYDVSKTLPQQVMFAY